MQIVIKIPDDMKEAIDKGSFGAKYNIYDILYQLILRILLSYINKRN